MVAFFHLSLPDFLPMPKKNRNTTFSVSERRLSSEAYRNQVSDIGWVSIRRSAPTRPAQLRVAGAEADNLRERGVPLALRVSIYRDVLKLIYCSHWFLLFNVSGCH